MVFLSCATGALVKTFELSSEAMTLHRTMGSLNAEVTCARYNHNGKILASCSVDGGICLDVASSGELLSRFFYPAKSIAERRVNSVHFSSGSRFLASGGGDGCVRVWDLKTQEVTQSYSISASAVTSVTFSGYKDDFIVAGSESGAISVCDVQSAETVGFLSVDAKFAVSSVTAIQASPHPYSRQSLGSTYGDGSVRVWDLQTGQLATEFAHQHDAAATSLALSPVSKVLLVSGGLDRRVLFFDTLQRKELRSMDFDHAVTSLALCADGKTLAVGLANGEILVYDLRGTITPLHAAMAHDAGASIHSLQFASPNADASSAHAAATVFPQGQPVISTERLGPPSPGKPAHSETNQEAAVRKLQALQVGDPFTPTLQKPDVPVLFSPPVIRAASRPAGFTITTQTHVEQPEDQLVEVTPRIGVVENGATSGAAPPVTRLSPGKLGEKRASEPSLLSMLAESPTHARLSLEQPRSPPSILPLSSPTTYTTVASPSAHHDRKQLQQLIEQYRVDTAQRHRLESESLQALVQTVLTKYDVLLEDNLCLRRENESLRAHIQQISASSTSSSSNNNYSSSGMR